jgi:hypothetical protein
MRILNRPMFKYGGPIKEGVMHGMRNGGRTLAGGNQIGTPMGNRTGFANPKDKLIMGAATKILPKIGLKPGFLKPWWAKVKNIFGSTAQHQPITKITKPPVTKWSGPYSGTVPGSTTYQATGPLQKVWTPKGWVARDPIFKTGRWGLETLTGPTAKTWGKKVLQGVATPTGALTIAGITYSLLKPDGTPKTIEELKVETGANEKELNTAAKVIDPDAAEKLAKAAQNKRLKSYLDMMGYDRSKRTALGDALIDASAIVQAGTEEAGSLKEANWGKLINQAIQTTSKRLDKPEQIREAVGLMMTKGAIEKDIAAEKGSALDIKEKYLKGKLGEVAGERAALGKPSTLAEAVNITKATDTKGNRTGQALRHYFDGHLVPSFRSKLSADKIDKLGGEEIFKQDGEIDLGNGVYQVENSYIIVQGNKIIELADVFEGD